MTGKKIKGSRSPQLPFFPGRVIRTTWSRANREKGRKKARATLLGGKQDRSREKSRLQQCGMEQITPVRWWEKCSYKQNAQAWELSAGRGSEYLSLKLVHIISARKKTLIDEGRITSKMLHVHVLTTRANL